MKSLGLVLFLGLLATVATAAEVGFQTRSIPNGADKPLTIGIWYPTDAAPADHALGAFSQSVAPDGQIEGGMRLPLIVMSHGTGGWFGEHYDTALALAHAGFVVAAVSHTGDTYDDLSRQLRISERPAHLRLVVDYMTGQWSGRLRLNPKRIGAFGFSSGGFTVLAAVGGQADFARIAPHCVDHPTYFDCQLLQSQTSVAAPAAWIKDERIKAAVIAAPALGFTFGAQGLQSVRLPIQLWRAENDHILPHPDYAEAVRTALPLPPETHVVAGADHFDFLAPCTDRLAHLAPQICLSAPGFDRAAFHLEFNRQVVQFFQAHLK